MSYVCTLPTAKRAKRFLLGGSKSAARIALVAIKPTYKNIVLVSKEGLVTRPKRKLPDLDSVVKVDQFRTHLTNREFSSAKMLKFVGSDTLEAFGRQLVALHSPVRVEWARRFGVAASPPANTAAPPPPTKKPWLVKYDGPCSTCGRVLVKGTPAVWRQSERRMYCLECGAT